MAGQEAHAFVTRTRSEAEDFVRAEMMTVQRFEDSLHVNMMVNSDHVFMLYKTNVEITLDRRRTNCARRSSRPSLRNPACIETNCIKVPYTRTVVAEQEDAMMHLEADSTHALSRQHEEQAHKQHALFHEFDSAIRDKDETVHALQRELTNHKEHAFLELERQADMSRLVLLMEFPPSRTLLQ